MLTRDFSLKVKGLEDSGSFVGLASSYANEPDLQGDIVQPGAFAQAIQKQGQGYPLLWAHDTHEPIGIGQIKDSAAGLIVNGSLVMADPAAQRAYSHLKAGSIRGLSIGYTVPAGDGKAVIRDDGVRLLKEVRLWEISLVAIPADPHALVTQVKTLDDIQLALKRFPTTDAKGESLTALKRIHRELRRLLVSADLCDCDCPQCEDGDCSSCSNPDCTDPNCDPDTAALKALVAFHAELKHI